MMQTAELLLFISSQGLGVAGKWPGNDSLQPQGALGLQAQMTGKRLRAARVASLSLSCCVSELC